MTFTPIGFLPIPPASIVIMHVPVIIGGVLLGYGAGALLGGMFGVLSMVRAVIAPAPGIDFLFNPAASGNPLGSIVMAVLPRILLGLTAAALYRLLAKKAPPTLAVGVAAAVASLVHSFGVLSLLAIIFSAFPLVEVLGMIVGVNGLLELVVGVLLSTAICRVLLATKKQQSK